MTTPDANPDTELLLRKATKDVQDFKSALDEHAIVAITDSRGKITYVNDKFCAISQYSVEELVGQDHRILNSGLHDKEFFTTLWNTIKSGQVWRGEIRNRRKDGSLYWVDTTIVPFFDEGGKPEQYIAIRADITERKSYEHKLAELAGELDRKNQELETVIYAASHDLRSPLVNVQGFAGVVEEEIEEVKLLLESAGKGDSPKPEAIEEVSSEITRALGFIQAGAAKMDALLGGLLTISRLGRVETMMATIDVGKVVESNLAAIRYQIDEAGAEVLVGELPPAWGDQNLLSQVFANLFGNALKYASSKRTLRLEVSGQERDGMVIYSVRDNGIGIAEKYQDQICDLFHRLNPTETEGHGLGLAIVRRAMDRMAGTIQLSSQVDGGSTFELTLRREERIA